MSDKNDQLRYVSRATHATGWIVRFPARVIKVLRSKETECKASVFFADAAYGGNVAAREAAVAHREEVFARAGLRLDALGAVRSPGSSASVTGLCGVVPGYRKSPATGYRYVGRWYALQGATKVSFSVAERGMQRAFWEALRTRQAATGMVFTLGEIKGALRIVRTLPAPAAAGVKKPSV